MFCFNPPNARTLNADGLHSLAPGFNEAPSPRVPDPTQPHRDDEVLDVDLTNLKISSSFILYLYSNFGRIYLVMPAWFLPRGNCTCDFCVSGE